MKLRENLRVQRIHAAGFTLMEIMLVVTIIALLAGLAIYKITGTTITAQIVAAQADLRSLQSSLLAYRTIAGSFPSNEQGLQALVTKPEGEPQPITWRPQFPAGLAKDPWKRDYVYKYPGDRKGHGFDVYSLGEDGLPGTSDDIWPQ
jgi:general secretion pathway protein G